MRQVTSIQKVAAVSILLAAEMLTGCTNHPSAPPVQQTIPDAQLQRDKGISAVKSVHPSWQPLYQELHFLEGRLSALLSKSTWSTSSAKYYLGDTEMKLLEPLLNESFMKTTEELSNAASNTSIADRSQYFCMMGILADSLGDVERNFVSFSRDSGSSTWWVDAETLEDYRGIIRQAALFKKIIETIPQQPKEK
jgi:hypothetical protein